MIDISKLTPDERATAVEVAARVLREEFGFLTSGDLINALEVAAATIRAKNAGEGRIIKPAEPQRAEEHPGADGDQYDGEHPHGYWEAGDY